MAANTIRLTYSIANNGLAKRSVDQFDCRAGCVRVDGSPSSATVTSQTTPKAALASVQADSIELLTD